MKHPLPYLLILLVAVIGCQQEGRTDFIPYYPLTYLDKVKLSKEGTEQALSIWDSIRPHLKVIDSTSRGFSYTMEVSDAGESPVNAWLSFDVDTALYVKPKNLKLSMLIMRPIEPPRKFIYVGNSLIKCTGKVFNYKTYALYEGKVEVQLDNAVAKLIQQEGIRFDTDQGPTQTISTDQANNIKKMRTAYEALAILTNGYNSTDMDSLKRKASPVNNKIY